MDPPLELGNQGDKKDGDVKVGLDMDQEVNTDQDAVVNPDQAVVDDSYLVIPSARSDVSSKAGDAVAPVDIDPIPESGNQGDKGDGATYINLDLNLKIDMDMESGIFN